MPFKSEAQRKYLWANEPGIARDWTDKHGSGIAKALGGRIGYADGSKWNPLNWFSGGPESETNPTLFGTQNSLLNKASIAQLKNAIGIYQASGKLNQEQQLDYELKLKQLEALIAGSKGQAEGGLIGYFDGGIAGLL